MAFRPPYPDKPTTNTYTTLIIKHYKKGSYPKTGTHR